MDKNNPYATPGSTILRDLTVDRDPVSPPRRVGAGRGAVWLGQGIGLIVSGPATWALVALAFAIVYGVQTILLIGTTQAGPALAVAVSLLAPIPMTLLAGGVLSACHDPVFDSTRIARGIGRRAPALLGLGVLLVAMAVLAGLIVIGFLTLGFGAAFDPTLLFDSLPSGLSVADVLLLLLLVMPLMMSAWFAPALVAAGDLSPLRALALSLRACLKNILPLAIYVLLSLAVAVIGSILLAFAGLLLGSLFVRLGDLNISSSWLAIGAVIFVTLVPVCLAACLIWATQYTAFRDIFVQPPDTD